VTHPDPEETQGPTVRDRRRIDPVTGEVRAPQETSSPAGSGPAPDAAPEGGPVDPADPVAPVDEGEQAAPGAEADPSAAALAERTADLQRVQAEYANYRRRVDRDREAVREQAVANVLANLLPVLDDIDRARGHGELEGGFRSVGEALEQVVEKLGLTRFGEAGEPFDPTVHEALTHGHSAEVSEPTCTQVFQAGYRIGERVVRPARVAVADPEE
jgi:molecular chaperone GrpE